MNHLVAIARSAWPLRRACNANLTGANLSGAKLTGALGIKHGG